MKAGFCREIKRAWQKAALRVDCVNLTISLRSFMVSLVTSVSDRELIGSLSYDTLD